MRAVLLSVLFLVFAANGPVSAQIAGEDLPDMTALQSIFGGVSSGEVDVAPITDDNGLMGSGIAVPETGKKGSMAKILAASISESVGKPELGGQLEQVFNESVAEVELAIPQLGFQSRDYGVSFALFFIMNWELANDAELPPEVSKLAGQKLVQTIQASNTGDHGMTDTQIETQYDMFMTIPVAMLVMLKSFEEDGQPDAAAQMREFAGQAFEQVIGISPYDIDITDDGEIKGY